MYFNEADYTEEILCAEDDGVFTSHQSSKLQHQQVLSFIKKTNHWTR